MKILGLKLTHDGSVSIFQNNRLIHCFELEKVSNNNRFKILDRASDLDYLLTLANTSIEDFDHIIVDGWVGINESTVQFNTSEKIPISVAPYRENLNGVSIDREFNFSSIILNNKVFKYKSFTHLNNHILSAYMTSTFARNNADSYALIWDGGTLPALYFVDSRNKKVEFVGDLFKFGANVYSIFAQHFGPFKKNPNVIKDELSIAGKVMAYVAYGKCCQNIWKDLEAIYSQLSPAEYNDIPNSPYRFSENFISRIKDKGYKHEDIINTFHEYLGSLLVNSLRTVIKSDGHRSNNLCYAGGAALNIKWNSQLRTSLNLNIWIPPFPNDSGSSIGACCSELFYNQGYNHIEWNIFSGPELVKNDENFDDGWEKKECTIQQLAKLINDLNEPVLFLNSHSEIGPRALGNRSILGSATDIKMKDRINMIKIREYYRPVAPICLENYADAVFEPGGIDPYMLYSHRVKENWKDVVPAIVHHDGSARLQTVSEDMNKPIFELLTEYYNLTGIPLLFNTSANLKGSGFFQDIKSAMNWNMVSYIWSSGILYSKKSL